MSKSQSTTREAKAQELITTGAVTLYVGKGYATVRGSGAAVYTVVKTGCTCPDRVKRGQTCKHEIASRLLCEEFKACKAAAQRGETVRPSRHLLQALRWPVKKAGCRECAAPTDFDICSGCFFGQVAAA